MADLWARAVGVACGDLPGMGLLAGDRPTADVEVLAGVFAVVEFELARRMHAATAAGSLPLVGPGAVLSARGWAGPQARRLARAGALAAEHPSLAGAWAAGIITSDHVDAIARNVGPLKPDEVAAVVQELDPLWGQLSPQAVAAFVARVIRVLHPSPDPDPDEVGAHAARSVSFALTADAVILSGVLPRVEGEAVIAAVEAFAERMRTEADHVPASARRADGLVALVNAAHATGSIPTRGGLPVSVSVTLDSTALGDQVWTTSRGHTLTDAEARFTSCDALVTPILIDSRPCPDTLTDLLAATGSGPSGTGEPAPSAGARIAALASTLLGTRIPLAVGRTARTATPAQRRALAIRDQGCIIPGCANPRRSVPNPPPRRVGHRREHRPAPSGPALLGAPPPSRPRHVDHPPRGNRRPRAPTRTRRPTRNPLARQPQRTLDHHPHPPNPLATVRNRQLTPTL